MVKNEHGQELIERIGTLDIINYYANEMEDGGYGDIACSPEEIWKAHPKVRVMSGFGIVHRDTGMSPDSADDWYEDIDEVRQYALAYQKELHEEEFEKKYRLTAGTPKKAVELSASDLKTLKEALEELRIYRQTDEDPREFTTNGLYEDELGLATKLGLEEI